MPLRTRCACAATTILHRRTPRTTIASPCTRACARRRRRSPPAAPLVDQTLCRPRSSRHPPQCCSHPRLSPGEFASLQVNSPYINSCGTHRSAARIRARPGAKSQAQPPSPPATAPAHCAPRCPSQPCLLRRIRVSCTIPCLAELRVDAHTIPRHKSLNSSGCDNRE